jgi:S1-C subfamily serine protease
MDGIRIDNPDALGYRIATRRIGETATLEVLQRGRNARLEISLEKAPEGASGQPVTIDGRSPFSGATVAELSPALARRLGLPDGARGVAITGIERNSLAERVGLRPRDVIREVNGEEIVSASRLAELVAAETRWWQFAILRDGQLLRQTLRY